MEGSVEILEKLWTEHCHTFTILRVDAGPCFAGELRKHGGVFNAYGVCMIRNVIFRSCCSFGNDKADFSYPEFTFSCGYDIRLRVCGLHVKCGFVMVLSTWAVYSWTLSCKLSHDSISSSGSQVGIQLRVLFLIHFSS